MNPITESLWQGLTRVFIPESLANENNIKSTIESIRSTEINNTQFEQSLNTLKSCVKPGDLIIVRTPGQFYRVFRGFTGHKFDHLAIVLNNNQFLHVGPPVIRLLPIELLLQPNRKPIVLRPKLTDNELKELIIKLESLIGVQYDSIKVYTFLAQLTAKRYFGKYNLFGYLLTNNNSKNNNANISNSTDDNTTILNNISNNNSINGFDIHSFICTDAILSRLLSVSTELNNSFNKLCHELDYNHLKSFSINDVYSFAIKKPKLLTNIQLPNINQKIFDQIKKNKHKFTKTNTNKSYQHQLNNLINSITQFKPLLNYAILLYNKNPTRINNLIPKVAQHKLSSLIKTFLYLTNFLPLHLISTVYASLFYLLFKYLTNSKLNKPQKLISKL